MRDNSTIDDEDSQDTVDISGQENRSIRGQGRLKEGGGKTNRSAQESEECGH